MSSTALQPASSTSPTFTAKEGRRFAFPVGAAFGALAGIVLWRGSPTVAMALGSLGGALWVLGALVPAKLGPLFRAWMALAHAISKVTTPIFLGVMWLVVITPFALVGRLFGHKPLAHTQKEGSYWQTRDASRRRSDLRRQF